MTTYLDSVLYNMTYAAVTPSHEALPYEPRKEIFAKLSEMWLPRGIYGVYVAVTGCT